MPRPHIDDNHFRQFAVNLENAIDKYGDLSEETLVERQRRQVESLVALEKEFRQTLIHHPWGAGAYKAFVRLICEEKRNILAARPFFRERQPVFTAQISKALKKRAYKSLYKFHFNYQFIRFVLGVYRWHPNSKIVNLGKEITRLRTELVEMNMPLAISRARIFWSRTPKAQLTYMDLVQISCEGLMSAVDKFCLPYTPAFRAVAIGRMTGNFIENYSETLVHFFPVDKRKIYRANKLANRLSKTSEGLDYEALAEAVNDGVDDNHKTNPSEIADLMAASSCVSSDTTSPGAEGEVDVPPAVERFQAPESTQPDVRYEQAEAMSRLETAFHQLSLMDQKLLRLKGVSF